MQQLFDVYRLICAKVPNSAAADRLGISLDDYMGLKERVTGVISEGRDRITTLVEQMLSEEFDETHFIIPEFTGEQSSGTHRVRGTKKEDHVDMNKGEKTLSMIVPTEPRTPEEIITLLKIDTAQWRLAEYWNKEQHDGWRISARVVQKRPAEQGMTALLQALQFDQIAPYQPLLREHLFVLEDGKQSHAAVLSLQDLHFGKGSIPEIEAALKQAVRSLFTRSLKLYNLEQLTLVLGGDVLNADTFAGTTTGGTPVQNDLHPVNAYLEAYRILRDVIMSCSQVAQTVKVVYIPGNHDRLSSFHLLHALSHSLRSPNVCFDIEYAERKAELYGNSMLCYEHADKKAANNPMVYATEYPVLWGQALYRTLYTGHYHTKKTKEIITENEVHGFSTRHLPALCSTDYWHYSSKYTGNRRSAVLDIHCPLTGLVDTKYWSLPNETRKVPL